jgi:hypothetical protein
MGQRRGFVRCFEVTEGLGHAIESELMQEIEGGGGFRPGCRFLSLCGCHCFGLDRLRARSRRVARGSPPLG